ncbi:MAG: hypothetical protein H6821_11445 [Planctomycetaceae bacterium]|nr:hypothetical protein [Planctomycetales bacterium]MCA9266330.1 hypothetical protein [Planctomycetales bacterium]MCB9874780.1 hypothetical protein [Planctomycetaceae bacterium]MCB9939020.1 hypothetical protein [Planctomycetaceae bacterium]
MLCQPDAGKLVQSGGRSDNNLVNSTPNPVGDYRRDTVRHDFYCTRNGLVSGESERRTSFAVHLMFYYVMRAGTSCEPMTSVDIKPLPCT